MQAVNIITAGASTVDTRTLGVSPSPFNFEALAVGRTSPVNPQLWDNGSVFNIFT